MMHDYKVEVSRQWWMIHVPEIDQLTQARMAPSWTRIRTFWS